MTQQATFSMQGIETLTLVDLIKRAAQHKGLILDETQEQAYSQPIATCVLDKPLLSFLDKRNIKRQNSPDCNHEIFTLTDENPQKETPGWTPSNYWNFKLIRENSKEHFDLTITLLVGFGMNIKKRGILLFPWTMGSFLSPCDRLPHFRMFKAIVKSGLVELPPIATELAESDASELIANEGTLAVTWTDLGLGGIRSIHNLFEEFAGGNQEVLNLGRAQFIFHPHPYPLHREPEIWIPEPAQPMVFQQWHDQLEHYRSRLVV